MAKTLDEILAEKKEEQMSDEKPKRKGRPKKSEQPDNATETPVEPKEPVQAVDELVEEPEPAKTNTTETINVNTEEQTPTVSVPEGTFKTFKDRIIAALGDWKSEYSYLKYYNSYPYQFTLYVMKIDLESIKRAWEVYKEQKGSQYDFIRLLIDITGCKATHIPIELEEPYLLTYH